MTALIIFVVVLTLITFFMLTPLKLELEFCEDFNFKLKYVGLKLLPKNNKTNKNKEKSEGSQKPNENFLKKLFNENDFSTFLKIISDFIKALFIELKFILRHTKVRKFYTDISVSSDTAADTAIQYGLFCTAFYNLLKFTESFINLKFRQININADFENKKSKFGFSAQIRISPLFLLVSAIKITKKYIQFINKEGSVLNERK